MDIDDLMICLAIAGWGIIIWIMFLLLCYWLGIDINILFVW